LHSLVVIQLILSSGVLDRSLPSYSHSYITLSCFHENTILCLRDFFFS
jgi:hypothetical protein